MHISLARLKAVSHRFDYDVVYLPKSTDYTPKAGGTVRSNVNASLVLDAREGSDADTDVDINGNGIKDETDNPSEDKSLVFTFPRQLILATPPAEGLNLLVYILPPLAFLAGAYVLWRATRSWRREAVEVVVDETISDDPYMARIEEELQRRERGGS